MVINLSSPDAVAVALAQLGPADSIVVENSAQTGLLISHLSLAHLILKTQGSLRITRSVSLPGNAVVDKLTVKVTARRADIAYAATVAQLRGERGTGATDQVIIVDFGTLRTVARVGFDVECQIRTVEAWNGTEFPRIGYPPYQNYDVPATSPGGKRAVALDSDIRTQKLRVTVAASDNADTLMAGMTLMLPDSPRDLTLKVDGGAPVWSLPGPAVKGTGNTLSTEAWNEDGERLVDLTGVLAARLGNPLSPDDQSFELLLESAEAGVLSLEVYENQTRRVRRAMIGSLNDLERTFDAEGVETVALTLPDAPGAPRVQSMTMAANGSFGAERRLPPTGPDVTLVPPDATTPTEEPESLAELTLTPERATIFLPDLATLPALTGLRLNLTAGSDGAEVTLVPWSGTVGAALPDAALDDLTGEPVTLVPEATGWVTVPFGGSVAGPPAPWVALLVARGSVKTALTRGGAIFRIGPAGGPWRALPRAFLGTDFTDTLGNLGLACRAIGEAVEPTEPAPVTMSIGGPSVTLDPADMTQTVTLSAGAGGTAGPPQLTITRLGPGSLTLTDMDVITDI